VFTELPLLVSKIRTKHKSKTAQFIPEYQQTYKLKKSFLPVKHKKKKSVPSLKAKITGKSIKFIPMPAIPELILIVLPYKNYLKI